MVLSSTFTLVWGSEIPPYHHHRTLRVTFERVFRIRAHFLGGRRLTAAIVAAFSRAAPH
jgi:hypothetical protein